MDNFIRIANHVPLNFVDSERTLPDIYNFKHFDAWTSREQILPFDVINGNPIQPWQNSDIIFLQIKANFDPIFVKIVNAQGIEFSPLQMDVVANINGTIYLQSQTALTSLPEGVYKMIIEAGDPIQKTLESECFYVRPKHPNTLLFKYWHNTNNNTLWETGLYYLLRVPGTISLFNPIGTRTVYVDTPNNSKTVRGQSSREFTLTSGNEEGTPNYMVDKLQDIFDLNNVEIDGKGFSASDQAAKFTAKREDGYSYAAWQMIIRETNNRREKLFESEGLVERKVLIDYITEGKFFGAVAGAINDNTYYITKVE